MEKNVGSLFVSCVFRRLSVDISSLYAFSGFIWNSFELIQSQWLKLSTTVCIHLSTTGSGGHWLFGMHFCVHGLYTSYPLHTHSAWLAMGHDIGPTWVL